MTVASSRVIIPPRARGRERSGELAGPLLLLLLLLLLAVAVGLAGCWLTA